MSSTSSSDLTAEDIFATALDLPPEVRLAYVDAVCWNSDELHSEVVSLLADHQRLGSFLAAPPLPNSAAWSSTFLAPGGKLGRYTLVEPLGIGGMGAVYRARDPRLEREVAIKVLFSSGNPAASSAGSQEARALARLSHPAIAALYDMGEENGFDYIVMECVPGQTLAERLKAGPLPIPDAGGMARQVACALEEAHEHGVIHRDLKPGNIMLTPKGAVKVLDFGIAKLASAETSAIAPGAPTRIGTPCYMSPEQVRGQTVDARSDLWSLGVVLYESLTGRTPFSGCSVFATMQAIVDAVPIPARQHRPEIPAAVEQIILRLLEKDPGERFQTAQELTHSLPN